MNRRDQNENMRLFWESLKSQWLTESEFYGESDKPYLPPGRYYRFGNSPFNAKENGTHCVHCGLGHAHNYEWENEIELFEEHRDYEGTILKAKTQSKLESWINA